MTAAADFRTEMGTRRGLARAHPCNEQTDDDVDEGPQRARAEGCGGMQAHGRQCDNADDRGDCWESGNGGRRAVHDQGCGSDAADYVCWAGNDGRR